MIRNIIAAMVAAVAIATFTPAMANENLQKTLGAMPQINENCSGSVIYSHRDEKSGDVKTVILTADHCVKDLSKGQDVNVDFPVYDKGKIVRKARFIGEVSGEAYNTDLALIQLKDKDTLMEHVVTLAKDVDNMQIGDPVMVIGYPLGLNLTVTTGTYVGYQSLPWGGDPMLRATPDMIFGNSGGALMKIVGEGDKATYEQIGVTDAILTPMGVPISYMGLYVSVDKIREYLKVALPEAIGEAPAAVVVSPAGH